MAREPKFFNKVVREGTGSGMHIFVNGDVTEWALQGADIPIMSKNLICRAYACRSKEKGSAKIMLTIKEIKKENKE